MYGRVLQYAADLAEGTGAGPSLDRMRSAAARVDGPLAGALVGYADAVRSRDRVRITTAQEVLAGRGMAVSAGRLKQQLTKREYEVAQLAAQGRSNRWIAEHLGLSVRTIDAHLSRVFSKWDLHARTELRDLL
jgi:DNA-binding NarL/FixJ family response regulator